MSDEQRQDHPFGLATSEYYDDAKGPLEAHLLDAMRANALGARIDAADVVELPDRASLPLLGVHVASYRELFQARFRDHAVVVAADARTGRVYARRLFSDEGRAPDPLPTLDGEIPDGCTGATFHEDLFERLGLPREPASWCVWVIAREQASNPTRSEVVHGLGVWVDPEVERYLHARRVAAGPPPVWPPQASASVAMPVYTKIDASPPCPEVGGVRVTVERVVPLVDRARCVLSGSYRLPLRPGERVPADRATGAGPRAVVPITLVIVGSDTPGPKVFHLRVPSENLVGEGEGEAMGYFALDLLDLPGLWREPRTCFVYAVSGAFLSAPARVSFIDPPTV
ncbi:MAG: hypothetical protein U0325_23000 [Polyangiales bacterium]